MVEPRLAHKLRNLTAVPAPRLYAPPPTPSEPWATRQRHRRVAVSGMVRRPGEQTAGSRAAGSATARGVWCTARRWTRGGFSSGCRWCPPGSCAPAPGDTSTTSTGGVSCTAMGSPCRRQLWLDERGTTGDLADLFVRCECGESRPLYEAAELDRNPLDTCRGARPWLGRNTNEDCNQRSRLLIRTASNAYFPQVVSVLSLPDRGTAVDRRRRRALGRSADRGRCRRSDLHEEEADGRGRARSVRR